MAEFSRLQLILGDDFNTSVWAMHADLEVSIDELIRDLDLTTQISTNLPGENHSVKMALHRFKELTKLKLALPLAQVDAECEVLDRFLHHRLEELSSQTEMQDLLGTLSQRVADHQSRVQQVVYNGSLKHIEVAL